MMQQHTIHIAGGVVRNPLVRLTEPVTLDFLAGEHIAIVGPNGAGKSLLVDMLTEKYPLRDGELTYDFSPSLTKTAYDNIKYIAFRDTYGSADANYYYQQRWNAHDQEDAPLVREVLGEVKDDVLRRQLFELFSIEPMLDKKIILLSSGELRKFQLTKALLTVPRILIMDNPFIGLDAPTRELLFNLLDRLTRLGELQIVLVLSMLDDIPSFVTHVVPVEEMKVGEKMEREEYVQAFCAGNQMRIQEEAGALEELQRRILDLPYEHANFTSDEVVKLNGVSIRYDDRTILKELDWTVMRGEKWALSGENGAGKSTLLSLVCADNPQSYACDISLFGRKRGTGESIWEIKKHIGYVSPEMHRAYLKNLPAIEIVASGLHDSIGLYKRPHAEQMSVCEWWMDIFGIAALKDKPFLQLSSGEQRLALLARAFVKDPELLILDEPLHGLDTYNHYGGDADFTNMRSYLMSSGFEDIVSDQDFPVTERLSKWGAHDHLVFNRLLEDLKTEAAEGTAEEKTPYFRVLQTSSSHEPFEVPFRRLENDRLNAFAYTDSCAGDFVRQFRELPQWKNTVIVFVPDHLGAYPEHIDNLSVERYRIPLLMVGGAVREPRRIDVYGSQHDIAATLLAQLALPHDEFVFSKDMLNPASPHFAFFTVPDAFGMVTADNQVIFNCQAGTVVVDEGTAKGKNLPLGKAYLQKLYDDIAKR